MYSDKIKDILKTVESRRSFKPSARNELLDAEKKRWEGWLNLFSLAETVEDDLFVNLLAATWEILHLSPKDRNKVENNLAIVLESLIASRVYNSIKINATKRSPEPYV